jgi:hypothetical protein
LPDVFDVALDLVATIVRDGAVEDLGSPLGFVTVKPRDEPWGLTVITQLHLQIDMTMTVVVKGTKSS